MTTVQTTAGDGDGDTRDDPGAATFHHPYTPYAVQMQFMKAVYDVCERGDGQVGLFESPTGTGKSLSLICGALTWLRQHKRRQFEASMDTARAAHADEPAWVVDQMLRQQRAQLAGQWERREARLAAARRREQLADASGGGKRRRLDEGRPPRRGRPAKATAEEEEDEFLVGDGSGADDGDRLSWFSAETRAMMEKAGLVSGRGAAGGDDGDDDGDGGLLDGVKIYYASRTHSQLSQFIAELRRPHFPSSVPAGVGGSAGATATDEPVKHIPLSSRQRLCINPAVARLGSVAAINDRCAELQKPKAKRAKKAADDAEAGQQQQQRCPFMLTADNAAAAHEFRDTALATLPDIEDLFRLGKTLRVCPYYASRTAVAGAEIVSLPYPLLLQREAREALGIRLDRASSIVIVDEAHNLMDAVASAHAAAVSLRDLRRARRLLEVYVRRFGKRLQGPSRVMVGHLARVIQGLSAWLQAALAALAEKSGPANGLVDAATLLRHKGADQINLFALVQYIQASKLAYKVESYSAYLDETAETTAADGSGGSGSTGSGTPSTTPVLHTLSSFLLALTNRSSEGRIFYATAPPDDATLSFLLLAPAHAFAPIAASARAVLLAGGTMSPFADYRTHLLPQLPPDKITTLSCAHVVPAANLCVWTLASMRRRAATGNASGTGPGPGPGPGPGAFDFSFAQRSQPAMVRDLGMALLNLCTVVPDGVVVFFPSYGYLDQVVQQWQAPGDGAAPGAATVWDRLQTKKALFREVRGGSSDAVLAAYADAILATPPASGASSGASGASGALLLSVVGGKMSEGINFADRLGRCVVVVGLPFPNLHTPEWKARMEYVEGVAEPGQGAAAAREFAENACMRAVNQSIGRAIRHRGDYAAIVLADRRYASDRIRAKLPAWIRASMVAGSEDKGVSGMMAEVGAFFKKKQASSP